MSLRERFMGEMKASMKAGTTARTSTIRMISAKLKEADITARPKADVIDDDQIVGLLRKMVKERREAAALYLQGGRAELAAKEEAEILVITEFLPPSLDDEALSAAVEKAVAETGATDVKQMGKVVAVLKARYGSAVDMSKAGAMVKARLAA